MTKETAPKSRKVSFADWKPKPREDVPALDPAEFGGVDVDPAVERIVAFCAERDSGLAKVTLKQKRTVLRRILRDLQTRGLDLSNIGPDEMRAYRDYLADLADAGTYSRNYCSHLVRTWNATLRVAFGLSEKKSGDDILMEGFGQTPKSVDHITAIEYDRMRQAVAEMRFRGEHYMLLFKTYLVASWATGPRIGSFFTPKCTVGCIDWKNGSLKLRHMKNVDEHDAVLSGEAILALQAWVAHLRTLPIWAGPDTVLFCGPDGKPPTQQWANRKLKECAAIAGIDKPLTTHVIRKTTGTVMGTSNEKHAQLQLGISRKIYEQHYHQPLLEDRLKRRDLVPGSTERPRTPEEVAGAALLALQEGRITPDEFQLKVAEANRLRAVPQRQRVDDPGYS